MTSERSVKFDTKRVECPKCGARRAFAAAIIDGRRADGQGKCHACGVFVSREAHATAYKPSEPSPVHQEPPEETKRREGLLRALFEATTHDDRRTNNGLARFLTSRSPIFDEALKRYNVGTDEKGRAVFWLTNEHGEPITAKSIPYDHTTGRRRRGDYDSPIYGLTYDNTRHTFSRDKGFTNDVLYGLHVMPCDMDVPVVLVESEKSAVIASVFLPDFAVLATGGSKSLTAAKAAPLSGRDVFLLFDCDDAGNGGALKAADVLRQIGARPTTHVGELSLSQHLMPHAADGYDVGDYYIERAADLLATATKTDVYIEPPTAIATAAVEVPSATIERTAAHNQTVTKQVAWTPHRDWTSDELNTAVMRIFGGDRELEYPEIERRAETQGLVDALALFTVRDLIRARNGWNGKPYTFYPTARTKGGVS